MPEVGRMFFRVVEASGGWVCRRGRDDLDRHAEFADALAHIREVAAAHRPSQVWVHHLDGRIVSAAVLD